MDTEIRTGERAVFNFLRGFATGVDEDEFLGAIDYARKTIKNNGSYRKGLFFKSILYGLNIDIEWQAAEEMEDMFAQTLG